MATEAIASAHMPRASAIAVPEAAFNERQYFLSEFGNVMRILTEEARGVDGWWVIGGLARDAILGKPDFATRDTKGGWRDIDVLCSKERAATLTKAQRRYAGPLHVGGGILQTCIRVPANGDVSLENGPTRQAVPRETFDTRIVSLDTVSFPALPARTLLHLYCLMGMRSKDFVNALALARYLQLNPEPNYPEPLYAGFHKFARATKLTDNKSVSRSLMRAAVLYRESPLYAALPITHAPLRILMGTAWDAVGAVERFLAKSG
ncbi:hypothetical protein FJZ40_03625 [Candidatus Shapirobacteria bacterium]|nr:hypothetical protein [Candidatus Shapirobacteria bacterium]